MVPERVLCLVFGAGRIKLPRNPMNGSWGPNGSRLLPRTRAGACVCRGRGVCLQTPSRILDGSEQ